MTTECVIDEKLLEHVDFRGKCREPMSTVAGGGKGLTREECWDGFFAAPVRFGGASPSSTG